MEKYVKTTFWALSLFVLVYIVLWVGFKYSHEEISTTDFFLGLIFANLTAKSCMDLLKD